LFFFCLVVTPHTHKQAAKPNESAVVPDAMTEVRSRTLWFAAIAGFFLGALAFNYTALLLLLPRAAAPVSPVLPSPSPQPQPQSPPEQQQQPRPDECAPRGKPIPPTGDVLHVVSHTHWDREWFLPQEVLRAKLLRTIDEALTRAATESDFAQFLLDGQTLPLLDYLEMRPEDAARLSHAVACGVLGAGPWLTQPDEFLSSGECLVRNLLHSSKQLGHIVGSRPASPGLRVGYLPDAFGHASQMPQLLAGFNISAAAFARGAPRSAPAEAIWRAPDGSEVLALVQKGFYCNSGGTPDDGTVDAAARWFAAKRMWAVKNSATRHLLLMNGCDHTGFDPNVLENIRMIANLSAAVAVGYGLEDATVVHSSLERFIAAFIAEVDRSKLPVLSGELREDVSQLASVLSARSHQKQLSWACSHLLQRWAEPAAVLSLALAGKTDQHRSLYAARIERGWRLLLETMPHDSAAGCVVDSVATEVSQRLERCIQSTSQVAGEALRELAMHVDLREIKQPYSALAVAFNPLLAPRRPSLVVVEIDLPVSVLAEIAVGDVAASVVGTSSGSVVASHVVHDFGIIPDCAYFLLYLFSPSH